MDTIIIATVGICAIIGGAFVLFSVSKLNKTLGSSSGSESAVATLRAELATLERQFQETRSEWGNIRDDVFRYQAKIARSWGHIKAATDGLTPGATREEIQDELPLEAADAQNITVDASVETGGNRAQKKREIMRTVRARNTPPSV